MRIDDLIKVASWKSGNGGVPPNFTQRPAPVMDRDQVLHRYDTERRDDASAAGTAMLSVCQAGPILTIPLSSLRGSFDKDGLAVWARSGGNIIVSFETLRFAIKDRTAWVTFATPRKLNSISEQRLSELEEVLDLVEANPTLGAFAITGEGDRAFCVGLDLDLLEKAFAEIAFFKKVIRRVADIVARIERLPIPTVAAVNGVARAGGFEIALGCDFTIIADEARIGDAHTDSGVLPACATRRLVRRVGEQRAKALFFSARWLTGREAVEWGLALQSVPRERLIEEASHFISTLTDKPRPCLAALKNSLLQTEHMGPLDAASYEFETFVRYMSDEPYGAEAYRAFREKRAPSWSRATHGNV
jgi:enoyl-CoA hydratase/carnithine racemase